MSVAAIEITPEIVDVVVTEPRRDKLKLSMTDETCRPMTLAPRKCSSDLTAANDWSTIADKFTPY